MPLAPGYYTTHLELRLDLAVELVAPLLEAFVAEEVRKTGAEDVVLGLSGGIDSALAAAIAVEALGPAHVLGVLMPSEVSNPENITDAELVAETLGIGTEHRPIGPQIEAYFANAAEADARRRGNKMARERMAVLYDLSARDGSLVLGTSNKTELLLGYSTIFGDGAYALNPNGDLYKTQMYQLGEYYRLPEVVLTKEPSADLWTGQTSEGELGYAFYDLDRVLFLLVDERMHPEEVIAKGIDGDFVMEVVRRVRWAQFKRVPPLFAKVSHRTVGIDFRYLRDWGM